jgi:hypothetical protein
MRDFLFVNVQGNCEILASGGAMQNQEIKEIVGAFFAKYKKTEGDETLWSAPWKIYQNGRTFEIIFGECPKGSSFKVFADNKKVEEIWGWSVFLDKLDVLEERFPGLFTRDDFFGQMREMV